MEVEALGVLRPTPRAAVGNVLGWIGSVLVHVGIFVYIQWYASMPPLGFEVQLPAEVEFGIAEGMAVSEPEAPASTPPATAPDPGQAEGDGPSRDAGVGDAGARRPRRDAGPPVDGAVDAASLIARARGPDAGVALASEESGAAAGAGGRAGMGAYAPPGAQLALRLDMARIRRSRLAPDVRDLLRAIPDWQALLEGSGIAPVDDLDRVLIASPNMQRSRLVMAGRYEGDVERVRAAVARMAQARNLDAPWRDVGGIPVAPWRNADATERNIALVGPQQFAITRPEDLPRVLAVAHARAEEQRRAGTTPVSDAEALLSMAEGEVLSFEIEGARAFVRGAARGIPTRMHVGVRELPTGRVAVDADGSFADDTEAQDARDYWDHIREGYARNPFVSLMGLSTPLRNGTIEVTGRRLRFRTEASPQQVRVVLGYLRSALAARRDPTRLPPPGGAQPAPPAPPP